MREDLSPGLEYIKLSIDSLLHKRIFSGKWHEGEPFPGVRNGRRIMVRNVKIALFRYQTFFVPVHP